MNIGQTVLVTWFPGTKNERRVRGTVSAIRENDFSVTPGMIRIYHSEKQLREANLSGCGGTWQFPIENVKNGISI